MTLVLPFDVTTPRYSFCLFVWGYRELANSLLTLYVTGLKVVSNPRPFEQEGLSDFDTEQSPSETCEKCCQSELSPVKLNTIKKWKVIK